MNEIVIDANVFVHALNPSNDFFESAREIISHLVDSQLVLALDRTGKNSSAELASHLYCEYTRSLPSSCLSTLVIATLLSTGRVVFYDRPPREVWLRCKRLVPKNNHDAVVLGIGVQADRHEVVSNDYADFHLKTRSASRKSIGVQIVDSTEFRA